MSTNAHSTYRSFAEIGDENHVLIHVLPTDRKDGPQPWQHYMQDLDDFFIRLYKYHQKHGFACLVCSQLLDLILIIYSVVLPVFLLNYIDYDILFKNKALPNSSTAANPTAKVHIYDIVRPLSSVSIPPTQIIAILLACIFWLWKLVKTIHSIMVNLTIKQFCKQVLHITDCSSLSWQDVQTKLIGAKHLCMAHDDVQFNELDVHNRILRHANYMIAMINRGVLPVYFRLPLIGEITYFTQGLIYNCQLLFFRGPFKCIFEENWKLNDDIKTPSQRQICAQILAKNCLRLAIINLILSPVILVQQILYFFYSNAALVKRDPAILFGARNWSLYARWFCRHFNELDHELNDRLNHGYKSAHSYMNAFTSPFLEIIARFVIFLSGAPVAIFIALTVYDEDVLTLDHALTVITALTVMIAVAHGFIPPVIPPKFTKAELHDQILKHIHYVPHNHPPFTPQARASMSNLFQYKLVRLMEDLAGTIMTPYILIKHLRPKSLEIVDFFRNFTVEVAGTGDVCVFSMMNLKENGNPAWQPNVNVLTSVASAIDRNLQEEAVISTHSRSSNQSVRSHIIDHHQERSDYQLQAFCRVRDINNDDNREFADTPPPENFPASSHAIVSGDTNNSQLIKHEMHPPMNLAHGSQTEYGKLEKSLINFKLKNPSWKPYDDRQRNFIDQITSQATEQAIMKLSAGNQDSTRLGEPSSESGLVGRTGLDIDSSTAVGLSTLFLHEHARIPSTTSEINFGRSVTFGMQRSQTENDPLLNTSSRR